MRAPISWLREYVQTDATAQEIARRLSISALEVERVIDVGPPDVDGNLGLFRVGRVAEAGKHPNADKLQLCQVDVGEGELRQIVCGAWNFGAGATVAVGLPGALLPGAEAPLDERKLRGEVSRGMILSERELELGTDHGGIIVLEDGLEPGTPLVDVVPLHEQVLDVTPTMNRVDLLSMVGLAREVAALCGGELVPVTVDDPPIVHPEWVDITVEDAVGCPRYIGRVFTHVRIGPSPLWLRARLYWAEMRAISNVVDITNYVMHVYGSPLHAFDRTRLAGGRIAVRRARDGEELRTLDGTLRKLDSLDLLITDGERAVALAAIMGGQESEVTDETTDVLLEAANFEPIGILRTSERLALRTTGSNRWEKGVDPHMAEPAAVLASRLLVDLAGAEMTGGADVHSGLPERPVVPFRPERASRVIGLEVDPQEQRSILQRLGFEVSDEWNVTVPTWRARDVTREIDLVEEIARTVLDSVPHTTPLRRDVAGHLTKDQRLRRLVEDVLVGAGFSEAFTWSLVAEDPLPARFAFPDPLTVGSGDPAHDADRRADAGRKGERGCRQPSDRALRARPRLPPQRRAASGGEVAGGRDRRGWLGGCSAGGGDAVRRASPEPRGTPHDASPASPGQGCRDCRRLVRSAPSIAPGGRVGCLRARPEHTLRAGPGTDRIRGRDHVSRGQAGHRRRRRRGARNRGARRRRP